MALEIEKKNQEHSVSSLARKEIRITGVCRTISFDESYVMLSSVMGDIEVSGRDLKVDALDIDAGFILISGEICGINYIDDLPKKKRRLWG